MTDYRTAQSSYDTALDEYNKLLEASTQPRQNRYISQMAAATMPFTAAFGALNRNNFGGGFDSGLLTDSRNRLDSARSALEDARRAQAGKLDGQMDRLTGQARDALYQGLTGYNPQPLLSASGNSFEVPTGGLGSGGQRIQSLLRGR